MPRFNLDMYIANQPSQRWFPVEIRVDGERASVVEVCAANKHAAFVLAIQSMSAADLDRAAGGVNLRILGN